MKGSSFLQSLPPQLGPEREEAIYRAALDSPIIWPMTEIVVPGAGHTLGFVVSNDYFAIGEPDDYVRVPMNPLTAQRIADALGYSLPTARMVDLAWQAAPVKLAPQAMTKVQGTSAQTGTPALIEHSGIIDQQLAKAGLTPGAQLTAGIKKDIVISNRQQGMVTIKEGNAPPRTVDASKQVAIYGWHYPKPVPKCGFPVTPSIPGNCPIQGLSIVHDNHYADYSHGLRLVSPMVTLDGQQPLMLTQVLTDPTLAPVLSHEGVMQVLRQPHVDQPGGPSSIAPGEPPLPPPGARVPIPVPPIPGDTTPPPVLAPPPVLKPPVFVAGVSTGTKVGLVFAAGTLAYLGVDWLFRSGRIYRRSDGTLAVSTRGRLGG